MAFKDSKLSFGLPFRPAFLMFLGNPIILSKFGEKWKIDVRERRWIEKKKVFENVGGDVQVLKFNECSLPKFVAEPSGLNVRLSTYSE